MERSSGVLGMILRGTGVLVAAFLALFLYFCRMALRLAVGLR